MNLTKIKQKFKRGSVITINGCVLQEYSGPLHKRNYFFVVVNEVNSFPNLWQAVVFARSQNRDFAEIKKIEVEKTVSVNGCLVEVRNYQKGVVYIAYHPDDLNRMDSGFMSLHYSAIENFCQTVEIHFQPLS